MNISNVFIECEHEYLSYAHREALTIEAHYAVDGIPKTTFLTPTIDVRSGNKIPNEWLLIWTR